MNETEKRILKQKTIARLALEKTKEHFPKALIAGGAPRNWYADQAAKDIDIFIIEDKDASLDAVVYSLHLNPDDLVMVQGKKPIEDPEVPNKPMSKLFDDPVEVQPEYCPFSIVEVWELEIRKEKVQWIVINSAMFQSCKDFIERTFDFNICKVYFDGREIETTPEFEEEFKNKTITFSLSEVMKSGRIETLPGRAKKMQNLFPDFKVNIKE